MPGVFISYRRLGTAPYAGRLHERLTHFFRDDHIFMDLDLRSGEDFVKRIEEGVGSCDVLLAIIGPDWASITDDDGNRRLDDPQDFIRLEIEMGLEREDVLVIPVLVGGAKMPGRSEVPPSLVRLVRRHAHEISDSRWKYDTDRLIDRIKEATHDSIPPPSPATPAPGPSSEPKSPIVIDFDDEHDGASVVRRAPTQHRAPTQQLPPVRPKQPKKVWDGPVEASPTDPPAPAHVAAPTPAPPQDPSKPFRTWGWILGTIGAVAVPVLGGILAIIFGGLVIAKSDGQRTGTGVAIIVVAFFATAFGVGIWAGA